jgi:hypothetical protein
MWRDAGRDRTDAFLVIARSENSRAVPASSVLRQATGRSFLRATEAPDGRRPFELRAGVIAVLDEASERWRSPRTSASIPPR